MTIAIKYCGGCNASYDRVESVRKIKQALCGCTFEPYTLGAPHDAVIVVSGCVKSCVDFDGAAGIVVYIRSDSDTERAIGLLKAHC